ncbi:MAG: hypothetical protein JW999_05945 [Methanotrichaceae archaeon]|nr:hypothetical protein [Methanotrichaceae archaeon]
MCAWVPARACKRARLDDSAAKPGRPGPRAAAKSAARGERLSFSHQNFAASRLRVNL